MEKQTTIKIFNKSKSFAHYLALLIEEKKKNNNAK